MSIRGKADTMNHTALQLLCMSYINGNITDAKRRSRSWSESRIAACLIEDFGYSEHKARLTAAHMKGADCWQDACDAK